MYNLSVQDLQDIAVRCTTQFLTGNISLNDSLAKEAADMSLNSEQVKRAVEATNTLAYLKNLEKSAGERTTEFPLADYNEVIKAASIPESLLKAASFPETSKTSTPGFYFDVEFPTLTTKETLIGIHKEAQINERALEDAECRAHVLTFQLIKVAADIKKDPLALDKLSACVEDISFEKIARLVLGEDAVKRPMHRGMFKQAEVAKVENLAALFKEAEELVFQIAKRKELHKQASEVLTLEKEASLLGSTFSAAFHAGVKGLGKAVGSAARGAVGLAVKPVVTAGAGVAKVSQNAFAKTGLGKALAVPKAKLTTGQKIGAMATIGGIGGAIDASFYKPKQNPNTGNGGDVWDKLHNS